MEAEIKTLRNRVNEQDKVIRSLRDGNDQKQKAKTRGPMTRSASLTATTVEPEITSQDFQALRREFDELTLQCDRHHEKLQESEAKSEQLQKLIDDHKRELFQLYAFAEDMDTKARSKNIFISKLPEGPYKGYDDDAQKIDCLLRDLNDSAINFSFKRVGKQNNGRDCFGE